MCHESESDIVVYTSECSDKTDLHSFLESVVSGIGKNNGCGTSCMKSECESDINSVLYGSKPLCDHSGRGVDLACCKCIPRIIGAYKLGGKSFLFKESVVLCYGDRCLAQSARITDVYCTSACRFCPVKCIKFLFGKLCIVHICGSRMLRKNNIVISVFAAVIVRSGVAAILNLGIAAVIARTRTAYCGTAGCE